MANKKNRQIEEMLSQDIEKAVLAVPGVGSLVAAPINKIRGKEYVKGILVLRGEDTLFDIFINVVFGTKIPQTAFAVQEAVKKAFTSNGETDDVKINIHVQGIDF